MLHILLLHLFTEMKNMSFIELATFPAKEIFPGYTARGIHTCTMSLMYLWVEAGAAVPEHAHPHEQVSQLLKGTFELTTDGETKLLQAGMVAVIPPHAKHSGKAISACQLLDVFNPERADYKF